jgi:hypothetical protein
MRKIAIAAAAGAAGLLIAAAPASALSTYEIQTDGGANFDGSPNSSSSSSSGFSMTTRTSEEDPATGLPLGPRARFGGATQQQEDLSRDMGWQGTGYYLRPNTY